MKTKAVIGLVLVLTGCNQGPPSKEGEVPVSQKSAAALVKQINEDNGSKNTNPLLAIKALGDIGPEAAKVGAVEALVGKLDYGHHESGMADVQHEAVVALVKMGPEAKKAIPMIIDAIKCDIHRRLPYNGAEYEALKRIDPQGELTVPALITFLMEMDLTQKEWEEESRKCPTPVSECRFALGNLTPQAEARVVGVLIEKLQDPLPAKRRRAVELLGDLYVPEAKEAIPALVRESNEMDDGVRQAARIALGKIDPGRN